MMHAYDPALLPLPLLQRLEAELRSDVLGPGLAVEGVPSELWELSLLGPLREFLARAGKELRAALVVSAWEMAGGGAPLPSEAPLLVEVLHVGSLIIDDIQDGSLVRRGGRSLHLLIGEPLAINAGNWLYFYAEQLAGRLGLAAAAELSLRRAVSRAVLNCHYGQALDLSTRIGMLAQRQVPQLVQTTTRLKTGSLFELAAEVGAICAGASEDTTAALAKFGRALGIGLQMLDDLGGIYCARQCHKGHEDLLHGRPTWIWAWLAEELDELSYTRLQHAARDVERRELHPEVLAKAIRERLGSAARARVRAQFERALDELRAAVGASPALKSLEGRLARLEQSYE